MHFVAVGKRKMREKKKTIISDPLSAGIRHAHHHEEYDMVAHPETRQPDIFHRRPTLIVLLERRVGQKLLAHPKDVPTEISRKKIELSKYLRPSDTESTTMVHHQTFIFVVFKGI